MAKKYEYHIRDLPAVQGDNRCYTVCVTCDKLLYTDKNDWVVENEKTGHSEIFCSLLCCEIYILRKKGIIK